MMARGRALLSRPIEERMKIHSLLGALLLAAMLAPHAADAQAKPEDKVKVRARLGPEHGGDAVMMPYAIFRSSPTAIMVMRSPEFGPGSRVKRGPRIDVYDYEKLIHERGMEPAMKRMGQEQLFLEDLVRYNGKPVMLARNVREADVSLFYQYLDPHLTKAPPSFDPICSFPVQYKVFKPAVEKPGNLTRDRFQAAIARDSSHMIIHGPHLVDPEGTAFRLVCAVDRQMQPVWQHVVRMDSKVERSEVLDAAIDANGVGYLLVRHRAKGRPYWGGSSTYETVLLRLDAGDIASMPVSLPEGAQPTGGVLRDFGKGIVWAGIYAQPGDGSGKLKGNFIATTEPDSTGSLPARAIPFTGEPLSDEEVSERNEATEVAESDEEDDDKKKDEKRLDWVTDVVDLVERGDGGWFLVNEVGFTISRIDGETRRGRRTFYHGPILARSFDKDWLQQWSTLFRRWTVTGSPVTGRTMVAAFDKKLNLFMIDEEEQVEMRKQKLKITPKDQGKPNTVHTAFDDKGVVRTKVLLKGDIARDFFGNWRTVRSGKDQFLGFGADGMGGARYLPVRIDLTKDEKK